MNETKNKAGRGFIIAGAIIIAFAIIGITDNIITGHKLNLIGASIIFLIPGAALIFIGYSKAKKAKNNAYMQNTGNFQNAPNMQNFQNTNTVPNNQPVQTNETANGFCSKCGKPLNGDPFCSGCGSPVNK